MLRYFCLLLLALVCVDARQITPAQMRAKQREAANRMFANRPPSPMESKSVKNITFHNPKAKRTCRLKCFRHENSLNSSLLDFFVDGKTIPMVDFDIGPSWSGLIPISNATNETRKVRICNGIFYTACRPSQFIALLLVLPTRSRRQPRWPYLLVRIIHIIVTLSWNENPLRTNGGPGWSVFFHLLIMSWM